MIVHVNTFRAEISTRADDCLVHNDNTVSVVAEVSGWTDVALPLSLLILMEAARAENRGGAVFRAVVTHGADVRLLSALTLWAIIASRAVSCKHEK